MPVLSLLPRFFYDLSFTQQSEWHQNKLIPFLRENYYSQEDFKKEIEGQKSFANKYQQGKEVTQQEFEDRAWNKFLHEKISETLVRDFDYTKSMSYGYVSFSIFNARSNKNKIIWDSLSKSPETGRIYFNLELFENKSNKYPFNVFLRGDTAHVNGQEVLKIYLYLYKIKNYLPDLDSSIMITLADLPTILINGYQSSIVENKPEFQKLLDKFGLKNDETGHKPQDYSPDEFGEGREGFTRGFTVRNWVCQVVCVNSFGSHLKRG